MWTKRRDGSVLEILRGLNSVLRCLGDQVVIHAILPVEEEHRRNLKTSTQRVQDAGGNIALGEAALSRLGAVHVNVVGRIIERLLDA